MTVRLLRLPEVSEMTGIPENTLRFYRAQGGDKGPPSAKLGRRVVYRYDDVVRWIEEQFEAAGDDKAAS